MSFFTSILADISSWLYPYLTFISSSLIVTILAVFGGRLNKAVWTVVRGAHFLFRTLVFIALCVFGYGALVGLLVPIVSKAFLFLGSLWLGPLVLLAFVAVGFVSEKQSRKG